MISLAKKKYLYSTYGEAKNIFPRFFSLHGYTTHRATSHHTLIFLSLFVNDFQLFFFLNDVEKIVFLYLYVKKNITFYTVQNLKKELVLDLSLSDCSSPCLILTKSPQISGKNKSEACKPEELVKITNGFLRMKIFALAGNSN